MDILNKKNDEEATDVPSVHYMVMPNLKASDRPAKLEKKDVTRSAVPRPPVTQTPRQSQPVAPKPVPPSAPASSPAPAPVVRPRPSPGLTKEIAGNREQRSNGHSDSRRNILLLLAGGLIFVILIVGTLIYWQSSRSVIVADSDPDPDDGSFLVIPDPEPEPELTEDERCAAILSGLGINTTNRDSDGDGLSDCDEVLYFNTNPLNPDTDGDGYPDGLEIQNGYSPLRRDASRLMDAEIAEIVRLFEEGKFREPTISTLLSSSFWQERLASNQLQASPGESFAYEDPLYGYQLILPGNWQRSGSDPTNILFLEQDSTQAKYAQIQAHVTVDEQGNVSGQEFTAARLQHYALLGGNGVNAQNITIGLMPVLKLMFEYERESSRPESPSLKTSMVEYILERPEAIFTVMISCTVDTGQSCMPGLEPVAQSIEETLRF